MAKIRDTSNAFKKPRLLNKNNYSSNTRLKIITAPSFKLCLAFDILKRQDPRYVNR